MFTKLFSSIITSSIWNESDKTRVLWITMLALADRNGDVEASVGGLAHAARLTVEECNKSLEILQAPDPDSKNPDFEGRRIEKIERGFRVINYWYFRKLGWEERERENARIRKQKQREREKSRQTVTSRDNTVTWCDGAGHSASVSVQKEDKRVKGEKEKTEAEQIYAAYPRKVARAEAIKAITKALTKEPFESLLRKTELYARQSGKGDPKFIPYPSTWFNQERWTDEELAAAPARPPIKTLDDLAQKHGSDDNKLDS